MNEPDKIAVAVQAALNTALDPYESFDHVGIPSPAPAAYVEHTVDRQLAGTTRMAGSRPTIGWRVTTRVVAKSMNNARVLRRKVGALEDVPIPGIPDATPLRFESEDPIGPDGPADDGWVSGLTTWTFEAPNTATPPA